MCFRLRGVHRLNFGTDGTRPLSALRWVRARRLRGPEALGGNLGLEGTAARDK